MSDKPLFVNGWEVKGIRLADEFFAALIELLPLPAYLYFEGTSIASDVRALLDSSAVAPALQIPTRGTLWLKPSLFHVFASEPFIRELAELAGRHAEPEICDHFHAYNGGRWLMQWYDAFDDPLLVDESISELTLQSFCQGWEHNTLVDRSLQPTATRVAVARAVRYHARVTTSERPVRKAAWSPVAMSMILGLVYLLFLYGSLALAFAIGIWSPSACFAGRLVSMVCPSCLRA